MLFLAFSNAEVSFAQKELTQRFYITSEALLTTKRIKVIDQKEFATAVLNPNKEAFIVYVVFFSLGSKVAIHLAQKAQIATLDTKKVIVPPEYLNYANIFLEASGAELLKYTGINNHPINLVDNKQLPYGLIYSLRLVELKTLKTYIETNLANGVI